MSRKDWPQTLNASVYISAVLDHSENLGTIMMYFNIILIYFLITNEMYSSKLWIIIMIMIISCSEKHNLQVLHKQDDSYSLSAAVIKANTPIILFVEFLNSLYNCHANDL